MLQVTKDVGIEYGTLVCYAGTILKYQNVKFKALDDFKITCRNGVCVDDFKLVPARDKNLEIIPGKFIATGGLVEILSVE